MISALKEPFITGLGMGLGVGVVVIAARMISDFVRGLLGMDDEEPDGDD